MRAALIRFVALMLAFPAYGCGDRRATEAHGAGASGRLAGTWDAAFDIERSPLLTWTVADSVHVRGRLVLLPNRSLVSRDARIAPSDYGTHDIDFTPFGFDAREPGVAPTVLAGWIDADSVRILLDPASNGTTVVMRGVLSGEAVVGRWDVTLGRSARGGGRFRMVRPER